MEPGLKTLPEYFTAVKDGTKTAELRYNDRDYTVGDVWTLREYDGEKYTGRYLHIRITRIDSFPPGLQKGWLMLSFKKSRIYTWDKQKNAMS